ncbi:MAG TPA: nucleotidyltransferase family protein [Thermoanaerobaculia bacterium]|nr:nucleotidyltransferase family protein [Thermoanaerobaculia bacterium]
MSASRVAGIVLAAGRAERFGGELPKQLALFEGESLVRRAVRAALGAGLSEVIVVTGYRGKEVAAAVRDLPVRLVSSLRWAEGKASSIRSGLAALRPEVTAAIFLPCDQPRLDSAVIAALAEAHERSSSPMVVPIFRGQRGAPVLFARRFFPELARLGAEQGGRDLLERYPDEVAELILEAGEALEDVDTLEALEELEGRSLRLDSSS